MKLSVLAALALASFPAVDADQACPGGRNYGITEAIQRPGQGHYYDVLHNIIQRILQGRFMKTIVPLWTAGLAMEMGATTIVEMASLS